jgi:hypothetical protein
MLKSSTLVIAFLFAVLSAYSQSETHNFTTYDTTFHGSNGSWMIRISRPTNMFTAGSLDTASRPAIITMPGVGEHGNTDPNHLITYGPHWWLLNGWDGSVVLGNGTHYPILVTLCFIDTQWPNPQGASEVLAYLLSHYHIKRNSVHLGGLSQGAFTWTAMIAFEATAGAETGMKLATSVTALEGFTVAQSTTQYQSISRGDAAYGIWAQKYHGKYFGLEGTGDYRNVAEGARAMNSVVNGSAHFSYENLGGGGHCCWNSMYDPNQHNWQSFPTYGPYVATGADSNSRGTYKIGSSIFQWMLRQGDSTLVGSAPPSSPSQPLDYTPIPGTIQAEAFTANSGVATQATTDAGGGLNVGWIDKGDWMDYNVSASTAGLYTMSFRVASPYSGATLQVLDASGKSLTTVNVPNTGGFQNWTTVGATVTLPAGNQKLRIYNNGPTGYNINWMQFASGATGVIGIPGTVQAEAYSANNGVGTQATLDAGGGLNVGWIDNGDWMDYAVNVATAGVYTVTFRVASPYTGAAFRLQDATGKVLATMTMNRTGDFQYWTTLSTTATLAAGQQTLRLLSTSAFRWNINWMQFVYKSATAADQQAVAAQAQSFQADSATGFSAAYFHLYPNPVRDRVVLDISNVHTGRVKVQVISTSGSLVQTAEYEKTSQTMQAQLNVGGLAAGIYIIRVQGADWSETKKMEKW